MLEINNISKKFNKKIVLKDISFTINEGEIVSLLGDSGSGKSTILNIIAGFEQNDDGVILYNNKIISNNKVFVEPQERNIGFVFQNYALFPHLNIAKNIAFGISDKSKKIQDKIVNDLLELINMKEHKNNYPHELSGGQQQRTAIARVLARNSDLILFDEAFSSIDSTLKTKLIDEIKHIIKSYDKTAIFVTHSPKEALMLSDKIAYIEDGRVLQFDSPYNLISNPKSKSISKLFDKNSFAFKSVDDILEK